MRTQTQLGYAINALLAGPTPTESEEVREAFEREVVEPFISLRFITARVKIESQDAEPKDIATVRSFFDSLRTKILKFPRPE